MENKDFCHLHLHDSSSLLDGFGSPEQYVLKAKEMGFEYLAITNHGSIDSTISFQNSCLKHGIKPIIGCEAYIVPDMLIKNKDERRGHITILVKNQKGWNTLLELLTEANTQGFYYRPRMDFKSILNKDISGLVFGTACSGSFLLLDGGIDFFKELEKRTNCFIEIMPHNISSQKEIHDFIKNNNLMNYNFCATNDCHYPKDDDAIIQEVLLAIQSKAKWTDPDRWSFGFEGLHLRSFNEMTNAFKVQGDWSEDIIEKSLCNTINIAKECSEFRINKQEISLPIPKKWEGKNEHKLLYQLCYKRLLELNLDNEIYNARLDEEWNLIKNKNFSRYFLIFYDLAEWCDNNNILRGSSRGSVGGSLLAYLLKLTTIDPIKYNLLFARFLNEERNDYPDIDMDFEDRKRDEVINYLKYTYGEDNIAGISTFLSLKGRMAIRDVSRVFSLPFEDVDSFSKSLEYDGERDSLLRSSETLPEGISFSDKYPTEFDYMCRLEGTLRSGGRHASAIIVSKEPITKSHKAHIVKRSGYDVINWAKDDAEYMGLMKLDILGLSTLSIISETLELIFKNHNKKIDLNNINLEDKKIFSLFGKGKTSGIFQFNTDGISRLCKDISPTKFDHLVAINALYRPGTLHNGMVDEYVKRHKGSEWNEENPIIKEITKETYGVMCYQENIMQMMNKLAGMSWKEADKVRKIIGKSKGASELAKFKDDFVAGCLENKTMDKNSATKLWESIETFGAYGFNKSHAVGYAMIAYWCAWLKTYYPLEFFCANLTQGADDKKEELIREIFHLGITVSAPKIGFSDPTNWTIKNDILYCPFSEVKGIGDKKIELLKGDISKGFYNKGGKKESSFGKLLRDIGAYDINNTPENISEYLKFNINQDPKKQYPKLYDFLGSEIKEHDFEDIYNGKIGFSGCIKKQSFICEDVIKCNNCSLINECNHPVLTQEGRYNIFILGESVGYEEDRKGRALISDVWNKTLWSELEQYDLKKEYFHRGYLTRCFPKTSKKPRIEHQNHCLKWTKEEISKNNCRLLLTFGSTSIKLLEPDGKGISKLNGTTTWNEILGCWICWSVSPFTAFFNDGDNTAFKAGIKNFVETIKRFPNHKGKGGII